ncbi:MAG: hypothetical protein KF847_00435 [Pirellulales bacterium]|nr:hypothetical protein [Pirellulales bacterium]
MPPELPLLAAELAHQAQFLRQELGYQSDRPGRLQQLMIENQQMIREIDRTLRGSGDELGLVGWINVIRRTWLALVALLAAACGYVLNDVVDALEPPARAAAARRGESARARTRRGASLTFRMTSNDIRSPEKSHANP